MEKEKKSVAIPIVLAVVVGLIFQASFLGVDGKDSPNKAVIEFTKAYFKLDASMAERLCEEIKTVDDVDVVDQYIYQVTEEGKKRGLGKNYMKNRLYHIDTHTVSKEADSAQVRLTGKKRKSINPVFATVAQIFMIGDSHEVDVTFNVVKEDGRWKVCENPLTISI
jgi:hypothetical protein